MSQCAKRFIRSLMLPGLLIISLPVLNPAWGQVMEGSIIGNGNMQAENTGVAINGGTNGANINNNQNNLSTGSNYNSNTVNPVVIAPSTAAQQYSGVNGGNGGAAALVMPRNPLPLPNAAFGRSNFGLQFGIQNNPGLSAITGGDDALGFFLQGGVTIPFGKIPDVVANQENQRMDEWRRQQETDNRLPFRDANIPRPTTRVRGRITGLSAYNYATVPSGQLEAGAVSLNEPPVASAPVAFQQPKVLALAPSDVFNRPLHTGEKIGTVEVGREYPYLGHTSQGWVKILLPDGTQGWATTRFEYIKYDYTQIDTLAVDKPPVSNKTAHMPARQRGKTQ